MTTDKNTSVPASLEAQEKEDVGLSLEAQEKALEIQLKRLQLEELQEQSDKRRALKAAQREELRTKMVAIQQMMSQRANIQAHCSHKKGGTGVAAVLKGEGTSTNYAVIKHKMPDGRYWICCTRCLKEWHAANKLDGTPETEGYREALMWPTDNTASGSSQFTFERDGIPVKP
jgi:DNA-binding transcriptional MerR regulator